MKKILFILTCIALVSCSKKNEIEEILENVTIPQEQPTLIGKWQAQKNIVVSGKDNSTILLTEVPTDCEKRGYTEFRADNKFSHVEFKLTNNECTQDGAIEYFPFVYNPTSKQLKMAFEDYEVKELTNNSLEIILDRLDYNQDGFLDKTIQINKKL